MKTEKKKLAFRLLFLFSLIYLGVVSLYAIELMSPATQLGEKKLHAEIYYRHIAQQDLTINVGASGSVNVRNSTIPVSSMAELDTEGSGDGILARISFQPYENLLRFYAIGGISSYDLKVPSGSFSNNFATHEPGFVIGGGVKYTFAPYTMVTPAFSLDLSATHSRYKLTRFASGDGQVSADINHRLVIFEIQGALTTSKKFYFHLGKRRVSLDPYAGLKVNRIRTNLNQLENGAHFSGTHTGVSPFFGFKFKPHKYVGLVVEGSVLSEYSASAGLTVGF